MYDHMFARQDKQTAAAAAEYVPALQSVQEGRDAEREDAELVTARARRLRPAREAKALTLHHHLRRGPPHQLALALLPRRNRHEAVPDPSLHAIAER